MRPCFIETVLARGSPQKCNSFVDKFGLFLFIPANRIQLSTIERGGEETVRDTNYTVPLRGHSHRRKIGGFGKGATHTKRIRKRDKNRHETAV